jgi:hypothetical protein
MVDCEVALPEKEPERFGMDTPYVCLFHSLLEAMVDCQVALPDKEPERFGM